MSIKREVSKYPIDNIVRREEIHRETVSIVKTYPLNELSWITVGELKLFASHFGDWPNDHKIFISRHDGEIRLGGPMTRTVQLSATREIGGDNA